MDEMRIKLHSRVMRGIVRKLISNAIYKSTGCKPNICIKELGIETVDKRIAFNISLEGDISEAVLYKIDKIIE